MQGRPVAAHPAKDNPVKPIAATWHSNAIWAQTGYGTQTHQVVTRMTRDGHAIAVAANYGIEATMTEWDGITHFPRGYDPYNNDIVGPYFDDWTAQHPDHRHMQFTLFDVWVYNSPRFDDIPTVSWVPIDHAPVPPAVKAFLDKPTVTPIAMSKFGHEQLQLAGIDGHYIPHAIETSIFQPTKNVDVNGVLMTGRELMGIDRDRFVVGCFNANKGVSPSRKAWAENIMAFSVFAANHDDAVLYLHTDIYGAMGGLKLQELLTAVGLKPHQYKWINQYAYRSGIPQQALAALYTDTDVLLAASMGEGFGLTVLEAAACGTRAIVSDFSAQPELVEDGWLVDGQPWWDAAQKAWFFMPHIGSIVEQLEAAYAKGQAKSKRAVKWVRENYDADVVYEKLWRPLLGQL